MATTPAPLPLARFRAELYQSVLGLRRDALSELLDAVLTVTQPSSLVRLSLAPVFDRGWASVSDALTDGTLDVAALRRLCVTLLPPPPADQRPLWAIDGSIWPRPEAKTSPERTWGRFATAGTPQSGIIGAWEYQWLMALPEPTGSWVLPLDVARRGLAAGTPTTLAIRQVRAALAAYPVTALRPLVVLDSHYDLAELVEADLAVAWLARLACHRRFYRAPPPYAGKGRPRTHGAVFRLKDATSHGRPDRMQTDADPDYGTVTIDVWDRLHAQATPAVEVTVVRVTVAHLPRRTEPPAPLWLAWHGGAVPADLRVVWHWYQRRFAIEHGFGSSSRSWAGPAPARARQRRPTAGAGCWPLGCGSCGWRATTSPMHACPGNARWHPTGSVRGACAAPLPGFCSGSAPPHEALARGESRPGGASGSVPAVLPALRCSGAVRHRPLDPAHRPRSRSPPGIARGATPPVCPNSRF